MRMDKILDRLDFVISSMTFIGKIQTLCAAVGKIDRITDGMFCNSFNLNLCHGTLTIITEEDIPFMVRGREISQTSTTLAFVELESPGVYRVSIKGSSDRYLICSGARKTVNSATLDRWVVA